MNRFEKAEDGWYLLNTKGKRVRKMEDVCFLVDVRHGLALFPGSDEEVDGVVERVRRKSPKGDREKVCKACLGRELNEEEASFMIANCKAPRRVSMRMKKK